MSSQSPRGKWAQTDYRFLTSLPWFQLLELKPKTGRTHQIRVHLSEHLNTPILCDPLYGNPQQQRTNLPPQAQTLLKRWEYPLLHATKLAFLHPITSAPLQWEVSPPKPFQDILNLNKIHQ